MSDKQSIGIQIFYWQISPDYLSILPCVSSHESESYVLSIAATNYGPTAFKSDSIKYFLYFHNSRATFKVLDIYVSDTENGGRV